MEHKASVLVKDASSMSKMFYRMGMPLGLEALVANRDGNEIRLTFEQKGGFGFELGANPADAIASLEVSAPVACFGKAAELEELVTSMRNVQWSNPDEFPKWDFARAVQAELSTLNSLQESLCPKGSFCGYELMSSSEDWFVRQVAEHSTTHYGDFCLIPSFTRSFLIFLKQHKHLGRYDLPRYEMHLWVFI